MMIRQRQHPRAIRYLLCSALAAAFVTGCATSGPLAQMAAKTSAVAPLSDNARDRAVAEAEKAVLASPQDAAARVALGDAYLAAGRFTAAAATFNDAVVLGEQSPRTALSLALAEVGSGNSAAAVAILENWRDAIPSSDLGLALALAGETERGVSLLGNALRDGGDSPKLRQNLAYAYALDGRWREARLMAAQDLPADQLDARISHWAMQGKPEDFGKRVAGLIGAPVRQDPGQPAALALNGPAPAVASAPQLASAGGELPPLSAAYDTHDAYEGGAELADREVQPVRSGAQVAVAEPLVPVAAPLASAHVDPAFVSNPVVQPLPPRSAVQPRVAAGVVRQPVETAQGASTHLVQLGSFSSESNAKRAWKLFVARNPELRDREMTITRAVVNGRHYWRVAAAGFDRRSAAQVCSKVKGRGGGCIAHSADRPLPGASPTRGGAGLLMARR